VGEKAAVRPDIVRRGKRPCVADLLSICAVLALPATARADDAAFGGDAIQIHGFVSQGFIQSTDNNYLANSKRGSFELTEVGINFTKSLTDQMRVGIQLFTRDLGPLGNYAPTFDWFYLDYRFFDWFGVRAGRTKLPFGLYNEVNDIDSARVPILLPQSIYSVTSRDFLLAQTGIELYGNVPLGAGGALEYRAYGGTIYVPSSSALVVNLTVPYLVGGRLMWQTPLEGLEAGGSIQALRLDFDYVPPASAVGPLQTAGVLPPNFGGTIFTQLPAVLWIASLEYQVENLLLAGEYSRVWSRIDTAVPGIFPTSSTTAERYYGMASYHVTPWFTPGAYWSVLYPNMDVRHGRAAYQHDIAGTLRFDVNAHWLFKVEGHYMHGTAALSAALNDNRPLGTLSRDWGVLLLKTTAYF
jgi:hypothetical protein